MRLQSHCESYVGKGFQPASVRTRGVYSWYAATPIAYCLLRSCLNGQKLSLSQLTAPVWCCLAGRISAHHQGYLPAARSRRTNTLERKRR